MSRCASLIFVQKQMLIALLPERAGGFVVSGEQAVKMNEGRWLVH